MCEAKININQDYPSTSGLRVSFHGREYEALLRTIHFLVA